MSIGESGEFAQKIIFKKFYLNKTYFQPHFATENWKKPPESQTYKDENCNIRSRKVAEQ